MQQNAFDRLKQAFTMVLILVFTDIDHQIRIKSDASDYATGAVLFICSVKIVYRDRVRFCPKDSMTWSVIMMFTTRRC